MMSISISSSRKRNLYLIRDAPPDLSQPPWRGSHLPYVTIPVKEAELMAEMFATAFINGYVRTRGLPVSIVSDRDTRFTSTIWQSL